NAAASDVGVPFRCVGLAPMGAMEFQLPRELSAAAWTLFLQESARRGVLFRRGGLNFVTYSHSEADVDAAAAVAAEALGALKLHLDRGTLAAAVPARASEGPAIGAAAGHTRPGMSS